MFASKHVDSAGKVKSAFGYSLISLDAVKFDLNVNYRTPSK